MNDNSERKLILHIANKNYSSWSLRPWILMSELNIPFEEKVHPFYQEDFTVFAPAGLLPCLKDDDITVWDSLAIIEYLYESFPAVWPTDKIARAWARSATAEMHSGFSGIRSSCSFSAGVRVALHSESDQLKKDLLRLQALWHEGIERFGGPFLAGKQFTAVDAFFAPIAFRVQTYSLAVDEVSKNYVNQLLALVNMQGWYKAALAEPWIDESHESWVRECGKVIADFRLANQ